MARDLSVEHAFVLVVLAMGLLGITHAIFDRLFWKRVRIMDEDAGRRLLGVDLDNLRSLGMLRIWRFFLKRECSGVLDRSAVRLGDWAPVSGLAFYMVFILTWAVLIFSGIVLISKSAS